MSFLIGDKMKKKESDYLKNKFKEINQKFKYINESVNLGTLDNVVLALLIFTIAIGFSILNLGFEPFKNYPEILVWTLYALIMIIPLLLAIYMYALSIFKKEGRFTNKVGVFLIIEGIYLFLGFLLIILFAFKPWKSPPEIVVQMAFWGSIIFIIIYLIFYRKKKVWEYLENNFPEHFKERRKEIENEKRRVR